MGEIPNTFEEAMAYFDDHVIYEPTAKRARYLDAVKKKFNVAPIPEGSNKQGEDK